MVLSARELLPLQNPAVKDLPGEMFAVEWMLWENMTALSLFFSLPVTAKVLSCESKSLKRTKHAVKAFLFTFSG